MKKILSVFTVFLFVSCSNMTIEQQKLAENIVISVLGMAIQTYIEQNGPYVNRYSPRGDSGIEIVNYETYALKVKNGKIIAFESR